MEAWIQDAALLPRVKIMVLLLFPHCFRQVQDSEEYGRVNFLHYKMGFFLKLWKTTLKITNACMPSNKFADDHWIVQKLVHFPSLFHLVANHPKVSSALLKIVLFDKTLSVSHSMMWRNK